MSLVRRAALIAGSYIALATLWILGTGALARSLTNSADELERFERYKGLIFVGGTGLLLLLASWFVLRRLQADLVRDAEARETMLELERHSQSGLFVSSIVHDANNVATVVSAALHELARGARDQQAREAVSDAQTSLDKLQSLFRDLKTMGRFERACVQPRELVGLVEKTVRLLRGHSLVKHCRIVVVAPEPITMPLDSGLVDQMLINLVLNAADATQGRGRVEVRMFKEGDSARLEVHDDGPGVPAEAQAQLFHAFKTTKAHGTGLGLLSVRECATRHGGAVNYVTSPLGGACFTVSLPVA
ncbi:MAG: HAMP domain-containing histidine kinase [Archangium sp.]|nr:HAMP domain-containing histidine kinase [Archangium sp.]